jgi:peptidoglycan/LPS O-acetylase OafA/YrhL
MFRAPDALTPSPRPEPTGTRNNRYRSLDFWRGLACLLLVIHHGTLSQYRAEIQSRTDPHGSPLRWLLVSLNEHTIRVPMFFVISGFCLAAAVDSARRKGMTVGVFLYRRFHRVYPPFLAAFLVAVLLFFAVDYLLCPGLLSDHPWAQPRPWWCSPSQWFGNLTLTETWRPLLFGEPRRNVPGQCWTLCYEMQFYVLMGLLLLLPARWLFRGTAVLTLATLASLVGSAWTGVSFRGLFLDGYWLHFAAGVGVFHYLTHATPRHQHLLLGLFFGGALWCLKQPEMIPGGLAAFVFALLLIGLHRWDGQLSEARWARPLFFLGSISYSVFLTHQLLVKAVSHAFLLAGFTDDSSTLFLCAPCCVAVSLLAGYVFYLGVERHFLNSAKAKTRIETCTRAEPISVPVVISGGVA